MTSLTDWLISYQFKLNTVADAHVFSNITLLADLQILNSKVTPNLVEHYQCCAYFTATYQITVSAEDLLRPSWKRKTWQMSQTSVTATAGNCVLALTYASVTHSYGYIKSTKAGAAKLYILRHIPNMWLWLVIKLERSAYLSIISDTKGKNQEPPIVSAAFKVLKGWSTLDSWCLTNTFVTLS